MISVRQSYKMEAVDQPNVTVWTKWGEFTITERDGCLHLSASDFVIPPISVLTPDGRSHDLEVSRPVQRNA